MKKVFLIGAGPGDPELLTVRAARLLQRAEVVLHDALVSQAVLDLVSPRARLIDVGKRCGRKLLTQEEINGLLITYAKSSEVVVRLKGGDPLIFGRAGEEIEALLAAGVEVEVVPGITAAVAAAAAAGVSLTDRRFASSVVFATAHRKPGGGEVQWKRVARSGSTLVIYMPGDDHARLAGEIVAAGVPARTPCVVVASASRPSQQILWTDLGGLMRLASLPAPAVLMVGDCARPLSECVAARQRALYTIEDRNRKDAGTGPAPCL